MIESIVRKLLGEVQDTLLDDFEKDDLNINLAKGQIRIKNISLKQNLIQNIHPLISIDRCIISTVNIDFSVTKLKTEPIMVEIDGIYVILSPKTSLDLDIDQIREYIKFEIQYRLKLALLFQIMYQETYSIIEKYLTSKLIRKYLNGIVKNLKINITNAVCRFEDVNSDLCLTVSASKGVIDTVDFKTINNKVHEVTTSVKQDQPVFTKKLEFQNIIISIDSGFVPLSRCGDRQLVIARMRNLVANNKENFIFQPFLLKILIHVNTNEPSSTFCGPVVKIDALIDQLIFNISTEQLSQILTEVQRYSSKIGLKTKIYRPAGDLGENWWKYLLVQPKNEKLDNSLMYPAYIELFAKNYIHEQIATKKEQQDMSKFDYFLDAEERKMIDILHKQFSLFDISICRCIVIKELWNQQFKNLEKQSFKLIFTQEQVNEKLREILGIIDLKGDYPQNFVILNFNIKLETIEAELSTCVRTEEIIAEENSKLPEPIGKHSVNKSLVIVKIEKVEGQYIKESEQLFRAAVLVEAFEISDFSSSSQRLIALSQSNINDNLSKLLLEQAEEEKQAPFLEFYVEKKSNEEFDFKASLTLESVCVFIDTEIFYLLEQIKEDLMSLKDEEKNHQFIVDLAEELFYEQKEKAQIKKAINLTEEKHHIVEVDFSMQSPVLIIPNNRKAGESLFIKVGDIKFSSCIPEIDETDFHSNIFDVYNICIKETSIFYTEDHEKIRYIMSNLDLIGYPEFSSVAKRNFLLLPVTTSVCINYCFPKNYYKTDRYNLQGSISQMIVNINNINIGLICQVAETIILNMKKLVPKIFKLKHKQSKEYVEIFEGFLNNNYNGMSNPLQKISIYESDLSKELLSQLTAEEYANYVKLRLLFLVQMIELNISFFDAEDSYHPLVTIELLNLELQIKITPYTQELDCEIQQFKIDDEVSSLNILKFDVEKEKQAILASVLMVEKDDPEFDGVLNKINAVVSQLTVNFNTELIKMLLQFESKILSLLQNILILVTNDVAEDISIKKRKLTSEDLKEILHIFQSKRNLTEEANMSFKIVLRLEGIQLNIDTRSNTLFTVNIMETNIELELFTYSEELKCESQGLQVIDGYNQTIHHDILNLVASKKEPLTVKIDIIEPLSSKYNGFSFSLAVNIIQQMDIKIVLRFLSTNMYVIEGEVEKYKQLLEKFGIQKRLKKVITLDFEILQELLKLLTIDISLRAPRCMIPLNDRTEESIECDLGYIQLSRIDELNNIDVSLLSKYKIGMKDIQLVDNKGQNMIEKFGIDLEIVAPWQENKSNLAYSFECNVLEDITSSISYECLTFVESVVQPSNNFGYNIVDDLFEDDVLNDQLSKQVTNVLERKDTETFEEYSVIEEYHRLQKQDKTINPLLIIDHINIRKSSLSEQQESIESILKEVFIFIKFSTKNVNILVNDSTKQPFLKIYLDSVVFNGEIIKNVPQASLSIGQFYIEDLLIASQQKCMSYLLQAEKETNVEARLESQVMAITLKNDNNQIILQYIPETIIKLISLVQNNQSELDKDILELRKKCLHRQQKYNKLKEIIDLDNSLKEQDTPEYIDEKFLRKMQQRSIINKINSLEQKSIVLNAYANIGLPKIVIIIPENSYSNAKQLTVNFASHFEGKFEFELKQKQSVNGQLQEYYENSSADMMFCVDSLQIYLNNQFINVNEAIVENISLEIKGNLTQSNILVSDTEEFIKKDESAKINVIFTEDMKISISHEDMYFAAELIEDFESSINNMVSSIIDSSVTHENSIASSGINTDGLTDTQTSQLISSQIVYNNITNKQLLRREAELLGYKAIQRQELPVLLDKSTLSCSVLSECPIIVALIDDSASTCPLLQCTLRSVDCSATIDFVYVVPHHIDQQLSCSLSLGVQTYNPNTSHYDNLVNGFTVEAKSSSAPRYYESDDKYDNFTDLQISINEFQANISPVIIQQLFTTVSLLKLFVREREATHISSFYEKYGGGEAAPQGSRQLKNNPIISIRNYTRFVVQYEGRAIDSYQRVDLYESRQTVQIAIQHGGMQYKVQSILCQDGQLQLLAVGESTILIQTIYDSRCLNVVAREKYLIINKTGLSIWFETPAQEQQYFTTGSQVLLGLKQEKSLLPTTQLPPYIEVGVHFLRVAYQQFRHLNSVFYEVYLHPTYIITNQCVEELQLNGKTILPFSNLELYSDPTADFTVQKMKYAQYSQNDLVLAQVLEKVPPNNEECQNQQLLYEFKGEIELQCAKASYHLGVHRVFDQQVSVVNPFNHKLVIYPFFIMRNNYCLQSARMALTFLIQNVAGQMPYFQYRCEAGDFTQLGIPLRSKIALSCYLNGQEDHLTVLSEKTELHKSLAVLKSDDFVGPQFAFLLRFQFAKNQLTKVISLLPRRVVRNNSEYSVALIFGGIPLHSRKKMLRLRARSEPVIGVFADEYLYLQYQDLTSSAYRVSEQRAQIITFPLSRLRFAVQTNEHKGILFIDIHDVQDESLIEVQNETNYTIGIQQCCDLRGLSKTTYQPSIDTYNIPFQIIKPFSALQYDMPDVSLPPVLNIKILDQNIQLSLQKIGKRKPLYFEGFTIFSQIDIRHNKSVVTISTHPIRRDTLVQKTTRQFNFDEVEVKLLLTVGSLNVSYYNVPQQLLNGEYKAVPHEIFRLSLGQITVNLFALPASIACDFTLQSLKLCNVMPAADYTHIIAFENYNSAAISLQAEMFKNSSKFNQIKVQLSQIDVNVDHSTVKQLLYMLTQFQLHFSELQSLEYPKEQTATIVAKFLLPELFNFKEFKLDLSTIYIAYFHVSSVLINLNVNLPNFGLLFTDSLLFSLLNVIGCSLSNIQNAELEINLFEVRNFSGQESQILQKLMQFYLTEAKMNLMQVLKSSSFFGSVKDSSQLLERQKDAVFNEENTRLQSISLIGGAVLAGYGGAVSGAAQTLQNFSNALTFDSTFTEQQEKYIRESQKSARAALRNSAKSLGSGIAQGISGLISEPFEGARQEGVVGALKGVGKGIIGVFAKPISGIAGAIGNLGIAVEVGSAGVEEEETVVQKVWKSGSIGE